MRAELWHFFIRVPLRMKRKTRLFVYKLDVYRHRLIKIQLFLLAERQLLDSSRFPNGPPRVALWELQKFSEIADSAASATLTYYNKPKYIIDPILNRCYLSRTGWGSTWLGWWCFFLYFHFQTPQSSMQMSRMSLRRGVKFIRITCEFIMVSVRLPTRGPDICRFHDTQIVSCATLSSRSKLPGVVACTSNSKR